MTACVNKHSKRVALAVTASLVGALGLGAAAPAVAVAEGISTMATEEGSVARGEVKYAHNYGDGQRFTYTGEAQGLEPTVLTDENESGAFSHDLSLIPDADAESGFYYFYVDLNDTDDNFNAHVNTIGADVYYMDGGDKVPVKGKVVTSGRKNVMPFAVGEYAVVVGHWDAISDRWDMFVGETATFSITARSLDDAALFQGGDPADTTINFTGKGNSNMVGNVIAGIGVTVDGGRVLDPADDFDVEIWNDGAKSKLQDTDYLTPGTKYVAKIVGDGAYDGEVKDVPFTYEKLDLSEAVLTGVVTDVAQPDDTYEFSDIVAAVDGILPTQWATGSALGDGMFDYEFVSDPSEGITSDGEKGVYTYRITAKDTNAYVKGSAEVQVMYVDHVATIDFGNGYLLGADGIYRVDLNEEDPEYFQVGGITVKYDGGKQLPSSAFEVTDLQGQPVTDETLREPGTHDIKVYVEKWVTEGTDRKLVGGYEYAKVVTSYKVAEAADVFFSFDGKNVESAVDAEYTGSDMVGRMAFKVHAGDKVLTQGDDYKVTFEREDAEGKRTQVDSIVDAGIYYITVEGVSYSGTAEFTLTVTPMEVKQAAPANDIVTDPATGAGYLMHTGEVLAPSYVFFKDGERVEVPEGSYTVERYDLMKWDTVVGDWVVDKRDAELRDTGVYTAYLETAEETVNYNFDDCTAMVTVTDKGVFTDVPMGEWYSQYVYDAVKLDYMNGYKGTELFGPSDGFTRAQAAIVLFNMAGGTQLYPEFSENSLISYETSFSDVDPNAWYAYAVKWCEETGIVKGYPNGEFGVDDPITREQFAVMLANYATKAGVDVAAAKADLSVYPDAGSIDSWAYEAMEWAVSEGVMGGNTTLNPTDGIQRSEVAKMAVTYQPERPETGVIPRP